MKARGLFVVCFFVIGLILSVELSAQKTEKIMLTNVEKNEEGGITKEYILMDGKSGVDKEKRLYIYNANNCLAEYTSFRWKHGGGWIPVAKREYIYWKSNDLRAVLSSSWNKSKNDWSDKLECMSYIYDKNTDHVAVRYHTINKVRDMLYAELVRK